MRCVDIAKYWVAMVPQGYEPDESTCRMLFGLKTQIGKLNEMHALIAKSQGRRE